jgi:RNA polymerase sigma factor (sigma-70 family)
MQEQALQKVVRHIRRMTGRRQAPASDDRELLRRFCRLRDEQAFAELLRKHGPMVREVCRRLLGQDADADDAFQAVFLVLVRRGGTIRKRQALASWLYGVAYRVCQKARREAVRRHQRETRVAKKIACDPGKEAAWRELCAELDAELYRLPEAYRAPLVHCYLKGQTRDQAARELGLALRTLDRRLERGREVLRRRLERRGLTLSATLLVMALSQRAATGALPSSLLAGTLPAAIKISAGASLIAGGVSPRVITLMEGVLGSILVTKLRIVGLLLVAVAIIGGGASILLRATKPEEHKGAAASASPPETASSRDGDKGVKTDRFGDPLPPGAIARLGSVRWRLQGKLADVMVVTEDGKELVTADRENGVECWDRRTGSVCRRIPAEPDHRKAWLPAQAITLSDDGRKAALADPKGIIHILDVRADSDIQRFPNRDVPVEEIALAHDSLLAARSKNGSLQVWDVRAGPEPRRIVQSGRAGDGRKIDPFPRGELAISRDGKLLAWVGHEEARPVHVYDVAKGQEVYSLGKYKGNRRFITFSPDGHKLASLSDESPGEVWDIAAGKEMFQLPKGWGNLPPVAAFAPDSAALALKVPANSIYLLELPSGRERWNFSSNIISTNRQDSLAFTPDGRTLFVNAYDPVLYRYDTSSGVRSLRTGEEFGNFNELAFAEGGQTLYSLGADATLCRWEATTGEVMRRTPLMASYGLLSPDGRLAAVGAHGVHVYKTATGKEQWRSTEKYVDCFSNDGKLLALSTDEVLVLRETTTGKEVQRIRRVAPFAYHVVFSPDNRKVLVNEGNDYKPGRVHVLDAASGQELRSWSLPANGGFIALSPDGRTLAFQRVPGEYPGGHIELWEVLTAQKRLALEPEGAYTFPLRFGFSPDGSYVVAAGFKGELKFYDVSTGKIHHRLSGNPNLISSWAFTQDQRRLATAHGDMTALVWDLTAFPGKNAVPLPSSADPPSLWSDLASADAAKAYTAIWAMIRTENRSVSFLSQALLPVGAIDEAQMEAWVKQLDNDRFAVRQNAARELEKAAQAAKPFLERVLQGKTSPEVDQRLRQIVAKLEQTSEHLRALRAVEVLEHIGTPEARRLLETLAHGQPHVALTEEARAALQRLGK